MRLKPLVVKGKETWSLGLLSLGLLSLGLHSLGPRFPWARPSSEAGERQNQHHQGGKGDRFGGVPEVYGHDLLSSRIVYGPFMFYLSSSVKPRCKSLWKRD